MIEALVLCRGSRFTVLALRKPGADLSFFGQYMAGQDKSVRDKMLYAIKRLGEHGPPTNTEKGRKLKGGWELWELKGFQWRVIWFHGRRHAGLPTVVLASAFTKKQDRTPPAELERAAERRALYLEKYHDS